jgi:hypothetical protein
MFALKENILKNLTALLVFCFLLTFFQIYFYKAFMKGESSILIYISNFQYLVYIYNLVVFNNFLKTELENLSFRFLTLLLIILYSLYIILQGFSYAKIINDNFISSGIVYLIISIVGFIFIIKLFRIEAGRYKIQLNLVAVTLLLSSILGYIHMLSFAYPSYADSLVWFYLIYLLPDLAYAYLYFSLLKHRKSGIYIEPEDRYKIE